MNDIGVTDITVGFGDVDASDRLTLSRVFDYFQEGAIRHADSLGAGREDLAEKGQAWILSRISVVVERRPKFREQITVRTWPRGCEKLFARRDYDILDADGSILARGRSGWLVLDIEKRRPLRPQPVVEPLPKNEGLDALDETANPATREGLLPAGTRIPCYSDIDYNGHVNNARYVQWIQDITDADRLIRADGMRLDLSYLSETKLGEEAALFKAVLDDSSFAYEGRKFSALDAEAAPIFRAELKLF